MTNHHPTIIDVNAFKEHITHHPDACIIDVREQAEWDTGHLKEAIHLPLANIAEQITTIAADKSEPIYLYCKAGVRSLAAAQILINAGFTQVYSIEGGIMAWQKAHYPLEI
ncbi:MAG TPA: sulfurtransferase [Legionellales bacterium]|nr:sulfurtransferase [Legionellales bacterium]HCA89621.1 sulfurtransferase [Legionellales bacterium]|tara:strand:- start:998 stop:1330 length:333 start_codon:yes stop_codon:yes gene_type:complete